MDRLRTNGNSSEQIWRVVSELRSNKKSQDNLQKLETVNGLLKDPREIAEVLNEYFTIIGEKLSQNFDRKSTRKRNITGGLKSGKSTAVDTHEFGGNHQHNISSKKKEKQWD
ncbi:hypothetical protein HHI36_002485 [Cryptolaemus montrouzieri]|uniref:Uncharacterized protein n=1 Tax=Cryptolaemus montrouzieri TaxID=559131 RepID=A0ABD2PAN1_9CUCU